MLKTCNKTEIPPNPSKNAQSTILTNIDLLGTLHTRDTPFVSSIIPDNKLVAKMCQHLKASE